MYSLPRSVYSEPQKGVWLTHRGQVRELEILSHQRFENSSLEVQSYQRFGNRGSIPLEVWEFNRSFKDSGTRGSVPLEIREFSVAAEGM